MFTSVFREEEDFTQGYDESEASKSCGIQTIYTDKPSAHRNTNTHKPTKTHAYPLTQLDSSIGPQHFSCLTKACQVWRVTKRWGPIWFKVLKSLDSNFSHYSISTGTLSHKELSVPTQEFLQLAWKPVLRQQGRLWSLHKQTHSQNDITKLARESHIQCFQLLNLQNIKILQVTNLTWYIVGHFSRMSIVRERGWAILFFCGIMGYARVPNITQLVPAKDWWTIVRGCRSVSESCLHSGNYEQLQTIYPAVHEIQSNITFSTHGKAK